MNKTALTAVAAQLALIAAIPIIYFLFPVIYVGLIAEDNWGEYTTFVGFLLTGVLMGLCFIRSPEKKRHFWHLLLSVGALAVAMEEISWGQRFIDAPTPEFLRRVNFQSEIGFHNIRAISPDSMTYRVVSTGFLVYGFLLPLTLLVSGPVRGLVERLRVPVPRLYLSPLFVATAYFLVLSPLAKGEEIGEMLMGLSLGALAMDIAASELELRWDNKRLLRRILAVVGLLLFAWVGLAYLVMPALIESAYHGESIGFINDMISNQNADPLAVYVEQWQEIRGRLVVLPLFFAVLAVPLFLAARRASGSSPLDRLRALAVPLFLLVALFAGFLFTATAGSPTSLRTRMFDLAGERLPGLGHYDQAEAIVAHLEQSSTEPDPRLPTIRGILYSKTNRPVEAEAAFRQALDLELARYAAAPDDPQAARRIAVLHRHAGNSELESQYWDEVFELLERRVQNAESPAKRLRHMLTRAETYQEIGEQNQAIVEYLKASELARHAWSRNKIEWGIARSLSICDAENGQRDRIPWETVTTMAQSLRQAAPPSWCR